MNTERPPDRAAPGMIDYAAIASAAATVGLAVRGGFHPLDDDGILPATDGKRPATVVLLGNVGSSLWPAFSTSPEICDGADHPLDRWTRRVVGTLAGELGAAPLYPFGGPLHWPFQRWATRAEAVHPSPLGLLIHPDFGLWHAYRAALVFAAHIDLPVREQRASPCATCAATPCLSACPVGAFTGSSYDVAACTGHIASPSGADCMQGGCRARRACPVGQLRTYGPGQVRFHMDAFLRSRSGERTPIR